MVSDSISLPLTLRISQDITRYICNLPDHYPGFCVQSLPERKYIYASLLLGVVIQTLAKFSVVLMIERIVAEHATKRSGLVLKICIGIWAVFSFFAIAFQCGVPRPWEFVNPKCAAEGKLLYVIAAGNIITDGTLACYFIPIIWKLQMSQSLRLLVSSLFAVRLV